VTNAGTLVLDTGLEVISLRDQIPSGMTTEWPIGHEVWDTGLRGYVRLVPLFSSGRLSSPSDIRPDRSAPAKDRADQVGGDVVARVPPAAGDDQSAVQRKSVRRLVRAVERVFGEFDCGVTHFTMSCSDE
jgi:hypothetical protein